MSAQQPTMPQPLPLQELCSQSHPDRLFILASLFGIQARSPAGARVLELGAGQGGNVVPLASLYPATRFVAEVTDEQALERIRAWQQALDLANLDVRLDEQEPESEQITFDYIICPLAFQTATVEQRTQLLADIKRRLAPNGVALLAYPVLPGAYFERMTGEMMAFHAGQFSEPASRTPQARALLDFLAGAAEPQAYRTLLAQEAEQLRGDDYSVRQALQGSARQALYVQDFFALSRSAGLQYVGESPLSAMLPENFGPAIAQTLRRIGADVLRSEQYIDFLTARRRRYSLLVHGGVALDRNVTPDRIGAWQVAANVRDEGDGRFVGPAGGDFTVRSPLTGRVLAHLADCWPQAEALPDLLERFELHRDHAQAPTLLADLLRAYTLGAVDLRAQEPALTHEAGSYPIAWPLARVQAQATRPGSQAMVANALHAAINVDEFTRYLLMHLDGSRDRAALRSLLESAVANGELTLREKGRVVADPDRRCELLGAGLDQTLDKLGRSALLSSADT